MHRPPEHAAGITLLELTIALAIVGVLVSLASPRLGHGLDRLATERARDALAAAVARARVAAVAHGGARLLVDARAATVRIERPDGSALGAPTDLGRRYGIRLGLGGADLATLELRFDGLGIGRSLGGTVRLRRGGAEAGITVSSYGRVRRW